MHWSNLVVELEELVDRLSYGDSESVIRVEHGPDLVSFNKPDAEHYEGVVREAIKQIMEANA